MAKLTIEIGDAEYQADLNDFTDQLGYQPKIKGTGNNLVSNPVSREEYARQMIARYVQDTIVARRANLVWQQPKPSVW